MTFLLLLLWTVLQWWRDIEQVTASARSGVICSIYSTDKICYLADTQWLLFSQSYESSFTFNASDFESILRRINYFGCLNWLWCLAHCFSWLIIASADRLRLLAGTRCDICEIASNLFSFLDQIGWVIFRMIWTYYICFVSQGNSGFCWLWQ